MQKASSSHLVASYSLSDATLVGLGAIIGSGIFVAIGPAMQVAGPAVLLSLCLAAIPALLNGIASAALGATYPRAGGTYYFGRQVLGSVWGFAAGWAFLIAKLCSGAIMAQAFGNYLLGNNLLGHTASVALVLMVTLADLRGPKVSKAVNALLVAVKIGLLLLFATVAITRGNGAIIPISEFAPRGLFGVWQGAALLFSAYAGYARIATLAEEVQEPRRTLPRAVIFSLSGALLLYLVVAFGLVRLIGPHPVGGSGAPLVDAAKAAGLPWLAKAMSIGAVIASVSAFLVLLTGISRVILAMAREADLPRQLSRINAGGIPQPAVLASGVVVALLSLVPNLTALLAVNSAAILFYYSVTNLCALRLRPEDRRYPAFLCLAGTAFCLLLIAGLPVPQLLWTAAILAAGVTARRVIARFTSIPGAVGLRP